MNSTEPTSSRLFDSRKKRILFIAAGVVAILALAFAVYAILVTPSKQPYRDALAQYKNVYNANIAVMSRGTSLNASSATDEQFQKSTEAVKTALTSLDTENKALAKESVLASGEGKALYEAFDKKLGTYISYNTDMLTSMQKVRPVIYACSQKMTSVTEDAAGVEAMRTCATNLQNLEEIPDADYQALVKTSQSLYADFAATLEKRAALADPEGADAAQAQTYEDEQSDILEALNKASTTFSTNLQKHKQAADITNEAMALDDYLSRKSSII